MRINVIIFALDGVICQMKKYHYLAWKRIAEELDIPFTQEQSEELIGLSRKDSLEWMLKDYPGKLSKAEKEVLMEQKNQYFRQYLSEVTEMDCSAGLREILIRLKEEGYLLAVASSSKNAGILLKRMKLEHCIDFISDGNTSRKQKPNPEIFWNICEYANVSPKNCLCIEGSAAGVSAAKAAGMEVLCLKETAEHCQINAEIIKDFSGLLVYVKNRRCE